MSVISEKNCSKFGLKKLKSDTKDRLIEILTLMQFESAKFIRRDLNDSILKNFNQQEKEFIKKTNEDLESNILTSIDNILGTFTVDSPVVTSTLKLFSLLNF